MGHRDARRDALYRAAEVRDQRPWDARQARQRVSDAWGGVRRDVKADARRGLQQKPGAGAGKSAVREQDGRARDDSRSAVQA
jgi:hypothetical protein